ncbi:MAG TPA: 4-hydroxythreonine-4-phosphate dehydrogenase PdxA [Cytophagales bacterium]|nr:4-hydroxythreonine-4-phosphate dehydrogenase PdxA [Cytophagales bacterium]
MDKAIAEKPVIGITVGDFNGVGPEVIIKTLVDSRILRFATPVIYGSPKIFIKYKKLFEIEEFNFVQIKSADQVNHRKINLIPCGNDSFEIQPGKVAKEAGKHALESLIAASEDLKKGLIHAIVTAPINKNNIQSDEFKFPGHTEFFTEKFGAEDSVMFLTSEFLRVAVVTGHIPLEKVKPTITTEKIISKLKILEASLKRDFGIIKPRIAVLGLNPHAGEDGLLGDEEKTLIKPAIDNFKHKGTLVFGPYPADGFFGTGQYKKFDAVLAMYHDQGLIPFKTIAFETGVNFTAGLSVIRTSPDHGTAYNIAGKNTADESSFREAFFLACNIYKERKETEQAVNH